MTIFLLKILNSIYCEQSRKFRQIGLVRDFQLEKAALLVAATPNEENKARQLVPLLLYLSDLFIEVIAGRDQKTGFGSRDVGELPRKETR